MTGLVYLRFRYYSPELGAFIAEDNYLGEDENVNSQNRYSYCEGDPINYHDPTGHAKSVREREMQYGLDSTAQNFQNYANGQSYGLNLISDSTANAYIQRGRDKAYGVNSAYNCESGDNTQKAINGMAADINAAKDSANDRIQENIDNSIDWGAYDMWIKDSNLTPTAIVSLFDAFTVKKDNHGVAILLHWLYGGGEDFTRSDSPTWSSYMKKNKLLKFQVQDIMFSIGEKLEENDGKYIYLSTSMKIENGEDMIGYQYLHGTNQDVGGFHIMGKVMKNGKGDVTYDCTYIWNDIIDPNPKYTTDIEKADFAKSLPFANPKDYILRIGWTDKTIIKANPSWFFNQNSGWLSEVSFA